MIARRRETQLASPGEFADGFAGWLRGGDAYEHEAAASIFAETVLLHRLWLKSKQDKK